jgi:signal transduction histidine kinase
MTTGWRQWLSAAARLFLSTATGLAGLVLIGTLVVGLTLVPLLGLGVPVVAGALDATRSLAGLHRRLAAQVLGGTVTSSYTSTPDLEWRQLRACLRDRQTRRDLMWLAAHGTVGVTLTLVAYAGNAIAAAFDRVGTDWILLPTAVLLAVVYWIVPGVDRGVALLARALLGPTGTDLTRRIAQLTQSRAATVDAQAAELRRIERDLHDGAQARVAAVGMGLGLAAQVLRSDPDEAERLLEQSRDHARQALVELRDLVRGIHPPVLADRGLPGGLEAVALMCPVPVEVVIDLPGRPQPPVESAVYFAAAEALSNVGRHSGATRAWLQAAHEGDCLRVRIGDDGAGGADPRLGTGLRGIERRLAVFDGSLAVSSPPGGPTEIVMEVPCALSSPKTTSSSATG